MLAINPVRTASMATLALALLHKPRPDAKFMVMTAYLDESGTHGKESPAVIVAGFIADVAGWSEYEHDLDALLGRYGIEVFHAKKFRSRAGPFKGWTRSKQALFNGEFLPLADKHLAYGLGAILSPADYAEIYRAPEWPRKVRQDTEYGLAFRVALWSATRFIYERKDDWPLNIVLESGHRNSADALRIYAEYLDTLKPEYRPMYGAISFDTKDRCLPLAAADSLAHAMFRTTCGASRHPDPNLMSVGPTRPPYVTTLPARRTLITRGTLAEMRLDALYQRATRRR